MISNKGKCSVSKRAKRLLIYYQIIQLQPPLLLNYMAQQLTTFKPSLSSFPVHPTNAYNKNLAEPIHELVDGYHNHQWISLEDNIQFHNNQEYLKRFYQKSEIHHKFKLLGQYYRFHFEAPRLFMEGIVRIIENNVEEKRAIQYLIVTNEMNNNQNQNNEPANTHRTIEHHQKLIKDVSLSYEDFQDKPVHKQIIGLRKSKKETKTNMKTVTQRNKQNCEMTQKTMNRVDSMNDKKSFFLLNPRNQIKSRNDNVCKKNNDEVKFKKQKVEKSQKKSNRSKREKTQRSRLALKAGLSNQAHVSNKLSRSKSKTQLHSMVPKKTDASNNNSTKNSVCQNYRNIKSGSTSHQNSVNKNSVNKSVSKKQILGDKKNIGNNLSKKTSKTDLKQEEKVDHNSQKNLMQKNSEQQRMTNCLADSKGEKTPDSARSKSKQYKLESFNHKAISTVQQKMFNRALQLKKKKT